MGQPFGIEGSEVVAWARTAAGCADCRAPEGEHSWEVGQGG